MNADADVDGTVEPGRVPPTRPANFGPPDALRTIIIRPRATIRWLLDHGDGGLWVYLLLGALAFIVAPMVLETAPAFVRPPVPLAGPWLIIGAALGSCVIGALFFFGGATLVGRLLGGVGRWSESILAIAWGVIPLVVVLPFVLASLLMASSLPTLLTSLRLLLVFAAIVGSGVLTVFTFAEVQRFSWLRSSVALLLTGIVTYGVGLLAAMALPHVLFGLTGGVD